MSHARYAVPRYYDNDGADAKPLRLSLIVVLRLHHGIEINHSIRLKVNLEPAGLWRWSLNLRDNY